MLTVDEALRKCRDHWMWMAEHPEATSTSEYFRVKDISRILNDCYCCEYTSNHSLPCGSCPLKGYAWDGFCMSRTDSLYTDWTKAETNVDRARAALNMVVACDAALLDIED